MNHPTNSVGIIGHGRFGQTLSKLFEKQFDIKIFDSNKKHDPLEEVLKSLTIFIAVPIREFENLIREIAPKLNSGTTIIDVCSVKLHPVTVMKKYLPQHVDIIATHPLFGPDTLNEKNPLKMTMHSVRNQFGHYAFWKNFFSDKHFAIIEMTPDTHDRYAAQSQVITHFIGWSLNAIKAESTPINTSGYDKLLNIMQKTCNDSLALFEDMLKYNPYSREAINRFIQATTDLAQKAE